MAIRDAGGDPIVRVPRPKLIDPFLDKIEEKADRSHVAGFNEDVIRHYHGVAIGMWSWTYALVLAVPR